MISPSSSSLLRLPLLPPLAAAASNAHHPHHQPMLHNTDSTYQTPPIAPCNLSISYVPSGVLVWGQPCIKTGQVPCCPKQAALPEKWPLHSAARQGPQERAAACSKGVCAPFMAAAAAAAPAAAAASSCAVTPPPLALGGGARRDRLDLVQQRVAHDRERDRAVRHQRARPRLRTTGAPSQRSRQSWSSPAT